MKAFKESKKPRHSLYLSGTLQSLLTTALGATMGGPGFKVKVKIQTFISDFVLTNFQVIMKDSAQAEMGT